MVEIQVNYKAGKKIPKKFFITLANKTFKTLKKKQNYKVSLGLVGNSEMKKLNKQYRNKNSVTDVLSFSENDVSLNFPGENNYLGEIIICYFQAQKQAKQIGKKVNEEVALLFVHGLLHLMGYDHKKKTESKIMEELEQKIVISK